MGLLLAVAHIAHYDTTNVPEVSDGETCDHVKPLDNQVTFANNTTIGNDKNPWQNFSASQHVLCHHPTRHTHLPCLLPNSVADAFSVVPPILLVDAPLYIWPWQRLNLLSRSERPEYGLSVPCGTRSQCQWEYCSLSHDRYYYYEYFN